MHAGDYSIDTLRFLEIIANPAISLLFNYTRREGQINILLVKHQQNAFNFNLFINNLIGLFFRTPGAS